MSSVRVALLSSAVLLTACGAVPGGEQKITHVQENSSPIGYVSGRILAAADGAPVAIAVASTSATTVKSAPTDGNGVYKLGPLPTGSYTVTFEAPGFLKRSFPVDLQVLGGGMFPVGNTIVTRDVELSRPDATIEGQVVTSTGQLGKGATLYVDLRSAGFDLVASTRADAQGKFRFPGLPGAAFGQSVTVLVAPYDENGDGIPDYNSASRFYALFPGFTTYNSISLSALGVSLITSNISDGDLLPSEAIVLSFSGQIRQNQSTVTLFRNSGGVQVGAMLAWDAVGTTATLTPVGGNLVEGQTYYVLYSVRAVNGALTTSTISFTARPAAGAPPLGTVSKFRYTVPATTDSGLTSISLAWDALANAGGYRIYGRDSATATAYLLLSSIPSGLTTGATVNLSLFDSVAGDAYVTPLGHKNKVTLAIVAVDRIGNETPFLTAATIELTDDVKPTVLSTVQLAGSAENLTGGAAATVYYQVNFSEPMATDSPPQIVLPNAGTSAVWAWTNAKIGTFTITVPAGIDGRGTLSVSGTKDTSSNEQGAPHDAPLQ